MSKYVILVAVLCSFIGPAFAAKIIGNGSPVSSWQS